MNFKLKTGPAHMLYFLMLHKKLTVSDTISLQWLSILNYQSHTVKFCYLVCACKAIAVSIVFVVYT